MPRTELGQFICNIPVQVEVLNLNPMPKDFTAGTRYFYPTVESNGFWAEPELHAKIQHFNPSGPFFICKRRAHGKKRIWDLWRGPEVGTHEATATQDTLELQLARSLDRVRQLPSPQPIPIRAEAAQPLGTGTYGPVAAPQPVAVSSPTRRKDGKIPLDVAFREILVFVTRGLKEAGEQWGDQAKQDACCTLLISATKAGYTTIWNREDAA